MKKLYYFLSLFILTSSCQKDDNEVIQKVEAPQIKAFSFKSSNNPLTLISDVTFTIENNVIHALIPNVITKSEFIPDFTFEGEQVLVNGISQESGISTVDFSSPVEYIVQNKAGQTKIYTVKVSVFTGLPMVFIYTDNNDPIVSKDDYLNGTIKIQENFNITTSSEMKIKGRGNSTWTLPKKPYRIKFNEKTSILGYPKDKDWVLLANYTDKTSLRNETAFFMGRLSILEWTPRTQFVEVFINDKYNGTYQLSEQIKIANDRVNVTEDGFLLEVDGLDRLDPDDVYFITSRSQLLFNIKDPDVDQDSEQYEWIKNYVTNVENLLYDGNFDPLNGYAKYLDIPSFVDWFLINEITKNTDAQMSTSCYLNISPNGKLKMGPLWDFDIALGNVNYYGNESPTGWWVANARWFTELLKDPVFLEQVKTRFAYFKSKKEEIFTNINSNAANLKWSVIENDNRWNTFYNQTWPNYAVWGNYNNEVQYMKNWLDARFDWLEANL